MRSPPMDASNHKDRKSRSASCNLSEALQRRWHMSICPAWMQRFITTAIIILHQSWLVGKREGEKYGGKSLCVAFKAFRCGRQVMHLRDGAIDPWSHLRRHINVKMCQPERIACVTHLYKHFRYRLKEHRFYSVDMSVLCLYVWS